MTNKVRNFVPPGVSLRKLVATVLACTLSIFTAPGFAGALTSVEQAERDAAIDQRLGSVIDVTPEFTNSEGRSGPLSSFLVAGRPTIVLPVYFTCPRLCSLTQGGLATLINSLRLKLGDEYKVLSISIRSEDTTAESSKKALDFRGQLKPEIDPNGWEFLTGSEASVNSLMGQLGFHFAPDGSDMTHAASIIIVSPAGMISRYFFGIEYPPDDVRYALIDAGEGKIGTLADHLFLFCFRFDPTKGKYTLVIWNVTRLICGAIAVVMAAGLVFLWRREPVRASGTEV